MNDNPITTCIARYAVVWGVPYYMAGPVPWPLYLCQLCVRLLALGIIIM